MSKRLPLYSFVRCTESGCKETANFRYNNRTEQREGDLRRHKSPWRCVRHTSPQEVLRPDNLQREITLTATRGKGNISDHLFWMADGATVGSGFTFGHGYKAYANDFPEGTKLVVNARIELPKT